MMSIPFRVSVGCIMTEPSGFAGATTTYTLTIADPPTSSTVSFNFGGEFTTSSATYCPYGLYHASDGVTTTPISPAVFSQTTSVYNSGTLEYDSAVVMLPGAYSFYLMAAKGMDTVFSSQMTLTISCDASVIVDPTGFATVQYGTYTDGSGNVFQEFTLPEYTSSNSDCAIDSSMYQVSSSSTSKVSFPNPISASVVGTDLKIRRTTSDGNWYNYEFYIFVQTVGGAQKAVKVSNKLTLKSPCEDPYLQYQPPAGFDQGPVVDQSYTILPFEEVSSFGCNNINSYLI